jgi:hypothetical protein
MGLWGMSHAMIISTKELRMKRDMNTPERAHRAVMVFLLLVHIQAQYAQIFQNQKFSLEFQLAAKSI